MPRAKDGLLVNGSYNRFWKTENNYMGTIAASNVNKIIVDNHKLQQQDSSKILSFLIDEKEYFLRVLTPRECWLLMGFRNKDFILIMHEKLFQKPNFINKLAIVLLLMC